MKRRLAVTVLCGMLAVSALAGCGEAETAGGSSSGGESKKQGKGNSVADGDSGVGDRC